MVGLTTKELLDSRKNEGTGENGDLLHVTFERNATRQSVAEIDAVVISIEMENLGNRNLDQNAVKRIISN